jgi:hypothetical protein
VPPKKKKKKKRKDTNKPKCCASMLVYSPLNPKCIRRRQELVRKKIGKYPALIKDNNCHLITNFNYGQMTPQETDVS